MRASRRCRGDCSLVTYASFLLVMLVMLHAVEDPEKPFQTRNQGLHPQHSSVVAPGAASACKL